MRLAHVLSGLFVAATLLICGIQRSLAAPAQGPQVTGIFLNLDGIAGASVDEKHPGEIELVSFNWSAANKDKGKPEPHDALVLKAIDAATPKIAEAAAAGKQFPHAIITVRATVGGKPQDFVQYVFSDVQITVVSHTVIQRAEEQVQFKYGKLVIRLIGADGKPVEAPATRAE